MSLARPAFSDRQEALTSQGGAVVPEALTAEINLGELFNREFGASLRVNDHGHTALLTDEVRARVFEPFFTRRQGGTGLGLTFVQRVVQEHRGRVSVESEMGRGTVFRVNLPVAEVPTGY